MGYLCKYLRLNGWEPVVVTEYVEDDTFAFLCDGQETTYVRFGDKKGWSGKIEWGWTFLRDMLFGYKDRRMYREAMKAARNRPFDLVLCSTFRTFPMRAARRFARKKRLPLIVDLRDIIEQYAGTEFIIRKVPEIMGIDKVIIAAFRKHSLHIRNRILRCAAAVTTVSPWHVSALQIYNANTHLIYNGYDPELFYPADIPTDTFYITYTGRLYSLAMRDPNLLFQAVKRLADEDVISPDLFQIRWFVDDKSERSIIHAASKYAGVADYMAFFGYIPASEVPRVLHESGIILLLTNKADATGPKGIMTTKFFESLAVGKPILCVRGDEGCLEEVINRTRSGLSAHNVDETCRFIKENYRRWKEDKPYVDHSDKEEIRKYSRETQAKQFIEVFEEMLRLSMQ
jgi:glycosyltransferase involved in cell wall biosynthesis